MADSEIIGGLIVAFIVLSAFIASSVLIYAIAYFNIQTSFFINKRSISFRIVAFPYHLSYRLGELFHSLVCPDNIYSFKPLQESVHGFFRSSVFHVRLQVLIDARARHLQLFGEEVRGPFKSHLEFEDAIQQLFLLEKSVDIALRMLDSCEEIKECRDLRKDLVIDGKSPSIENLFKFFLSEEHWDFPGNDDGCNGSGRSNDRNDKRNNRNCHDLLLLG